MSEPEAERVPMKVVAHRGASAMAPENTMAAFLAAREVGADAIEMDVQATADGELVVIHDYAVDRTTNGRGVVFELTTAQIARLDAGSWFSPEFAGERVPRFADVVALDALELEVELKSSTADALQAAVEAVERADSLDRTEFTSWNTPMLIHLKQRWPAARIGLFSRRRESWMPWAVFERTIIGSVAFTDADVVHVYAGDITPSIADKLHELGRVVHANNAESLDDFQRAAESGADRVSTSDPGAAIALFAT